MKPSKLYDLKSFDALLECGKKPGFTDSFAGVVLARHLTAVDPKIFEKRYPELSFVNSGISVDNTGGYALRIQSLRVIDQGGFTSAGDASGNKGKIGLTAEDSFLNVHKKEAFSQWSDDDVKEAELAGINLVGRYLEATNKIYLRELDTIGLVGIAGGPTSGLLNYAFTSSAANDVVEDLTAEQMYTAIASLITDQWNAVNNTPGYAATDVMMPVRVENKLNATILNSAGSTVSVLQALKDNFPNVRFGSSFRAEDVGGDSVTIAYSKAPDVMVMRAPVPLTVGEIIKIASFDHRVDYKYRIAGLDVLETTGARILTGL
jgi:hypothetical protein